MVALVAAAAVSGGMFFADWHFGFFGGFADLVCLVLVRFFATCKSANKEFDAFTAFQVILWTCACPVALLLVIHVAMEIFPGDDPAKSCEVVTFAEVSAETVGDGDAPSPRRTTSQPGAGMPQAAMTLGPSRLASASPTH
jgi:hypothetical protein